MKSGKETVNCKRYNIESGLNDSNPCFMSSKTSSLWEIVGENLSKNDANFHRDFAEVENFISHHFYSTQIVAGNSI